MSVTIIGGGVVVAVVATGARVGLGCCCCCSSGRGGASLSRILAEGLRSRFWPSEALIEVHSPLWYSKSVQPGVVHSLRPPEASSSAAAPFGGGVVSDDARASDCAAAEKPTNTEDTDGEVIVEGVGTRGDVAGSVMGEGRTAALAPSLVPPPVSTTMPPAPGRAVYVPT